MNIYTYVYMSFGMTGVSNYYNFSIIYAAVILLYVWC